MKQRSVIIKECLTNDIRFDLKNGDGSDAVNKKPQYAYAVCNLTTEGEITGTGFALTLGTGNELVCQAIEYLKTFIVGKEIEELMSDFGRVFQEMSDAPNLRWLGPHKGIIHLALASVTNACFDLWAKSRHVPLWKLLIDLSPEEVADILDLSYVKDVLTRREAIEILENNRLKKPAIEKILKNGYRGYDTSAGWFNYSNLQVQDKVKKSVDKGFTALKLKVGSDDQDRDIERAHLVREAAGDLAQIMLDANQRWSLTQAIGFCQKLNGIDPYWIEEPTHPDDLYAHVELAKKIEPIKLAMGEHIPNRVIFKNYLQSGSMSFNQVDAVRVGGISEFITISLMSKKFDIPVVPHVGDMGQIHQHLVLFNQISIGHEALFLEHIPHLRNYYKFPARLKDGHYQVPQEPGASTDFNDLKKQKKASPKSFLLFLIIVFVVGCQFSESEHVKQSATQETKDFTKKQIQRFGTVIELKADKVEEYKELHANTWPGVLKQLKESNIQNYSIFLHKIDGRFYLFGYYEYTGDNYEMDMEKMAADSTTQKWWELTDSYQIPLDSIEEGEWWAEMEEIFHMD